jgi:ketosteroid isomerase-like protein
MDEIVGRLKHAVTLLGRDMEQANALLADLYAEDVFFQDPLQIVRGLPAFLEMNRRLASKTREIEVELAEAARAGESIFLVWNMRVVPRVGPRVSFEGVSHLRLRDGRVVYHRDYWDLLGSVMESVPLAGPLYRAAVKRLG